MVSFWKKSTTPGGIAAICWAIWKSRNKACFEGKIIKNPLEIICHACVPMNYWAGLYAEVDKEQLVDGTNLMLKLAKDLPASQHTRHGNNLQLTYGELQDSEGAAM